MYGLPSWASQQRNGEVMGMRGEYFEVCGLENVVRFQHSGNVGLGGDFEERYASNGGHGYDTFGRGFGRENRVRR